MTTETVAYRDLVVEIAGPMKLGENIKFALARVATRTGLSARRIRAIWNGEVKDIRARELMKLMRAARADRALQEAQLEYDLLTKRIAALEEAVGLRAAQPDRALDHAEGVASGPSHRALADG